MFWVKNGDRYFVNNDLGELLIMQFTPGGPKVIDRTQLIKADTQCGYGPRRFADALVNWVHPAYANRHVVIRNDEDLKSLKCQVQVAKTNVAEKVSGKQHRGVELSWVVLGVMTIRLLKTYTILLDVELLQHALRAVY